MVISASELHLRRAREMQDPRSAIEEYLKAIEKAVREMKAARPAGRYGRRR
jgi:hypothetical protein